MRPFALILLAYLSSFAYADGDQPADIKSLPQTPIDSNESPDEPQITITKQAEQTVEEYRSHGNLYMIKVTPRHGKPYYLVDDRGDGKFARQESLDSGLRVPRWVIFKF